MFVVLRRSADGLASVVNDDVKAPVVLGNEGGQLVDAGEVAEVHREYPQAAAPLLKVRFAAVPDDGFVRESCGGDNRRTVAEKFHGALETDLDPCPRDQGDAPGEVGPLDTFRVVEFRTLGAQLVVEVVQLPETRFANVAGPGVV